MNDDVYEVRVLPARATRLRGTGRRHFEWVPTIFSVIFVRNSARTILFDTGAGSCEVRLFPLPSNKRMVDF
jgi:hypothetical protein